MDAKATLGTSFSGKAEVELFPNAVLAITTKTSPPRPCKQ